MAKSKPFPIKEGYRRLFSIAEIEEDRTLQWCLGFFLVSLFLNYNLWIRSTLFAISRVQDNTAACWPFFTSCKAWYFLNLPPYGYSQLILGAAFFVIIGGAAYAMYCRQWVAAHMCLLALYIARLYFMLVSVYTIHNYWLYLLYFGFIFLCIPHKKFFARLMVVMCYFLASWGKIYDTWILGNYFSSMQLGLPLFPHGSEALFSNLVLFMEMAGAWMLFSSRPMIQRGALLFFICFHIYSSMVVNYLFPSIILPMLVMLFLPDFKPYKSIPLDNASAAGWSFMAFLVFLQLVPTIIPGDDKYTEEGTYTSLSMLIANHQCRAHLTDASGKTLRISYSDGPEDFGVCQIFPTFFSWQQAACPYRRPLHFTMDYSLNGQPFYRIIDERDFCKLTYNPFTHNSWIKDSATAPIVGYPHKNGSPYNYYNPTLRRKEGRDMYTPGQQLPFIVTTDTENNDPAGYNNLQQKLLPYFDLLCIFYRCLWVGLLAFLTTRFILIPSLKK